MPYELTKKVTLTNLFTDPSFEGSNWVAYSNCTVSKDTTHVLNGSYSLKIVTSTGSESYIKSTVNPSMVKGHKYYACISKYQTSSTINNIQFYWPEAEPSMYGRDGTGHIKNSSATANGWYKYSTVDTRSNWNTGSYLFRIDLENGGKVVTAYYDNAILIDLTADFGSGNEPDVDWCDENIPFFENSLTLSPFSLYAKVGSTWKTAETLYEKSNGIWQKVEESDYSSKLNDTKKYKTKYVWKKNKIYDEHTKLLLHFDKLPYADEINSNIIITSTGSSKITSKGKFANAAVFPADNSHYIDVEVPNLSSIIKGTSWTIDWWEYCLSNPTGGGAFVLSGQNVYSMIAGYNHTTGGTAKYLYISSNGSTWNISNHLQMGEQLPNQWVHRAMVKNGTSLKIYQNGNLFLDTTISNSINMTNNKIRFSTVWSENTGLSGYMDEFRISDIARWTGNFTPSTQRYLPIENLGYVYSDTYDAYNENNGDYYYERL